jgi:hypothetical protein
MTTGMATNRKTAAISLVIAFLIAIKRSSPIRPTRIRQTCVPAGYAGLEQDHGVEFFPYSRHTLLWTGG